MPIDGWAIDDQDGDGDDDDEEEGHPGEGTAGLQVTISIGEDSGSYGGSYSEVMGVNPDVQSHVPVRIPCKSCGSWG